MAKRTMTLRFFVWIFLSTGLAAFLSACSTSVSGSADPNLKQQSQAQLNLPGFGAPKVQNPLTNIQRFEQNPCAALAIEQLKQLRVPLSGNPNMGAAGPRCRWSDPIDGPSVSIQWIESDRRGLTSFYEDRNQYEVFEELPNINGHPVVNYTSSAELKTGLCTLLVGVADDLAFQAGATRASGQSEKVNPCDTAYTAAGMALRTINSGG